MARKLYATSSTMISLRPMSCLFDQAETPALIDRCNTDLPAVCENMAERTGTNFAALLQLGVFLKFLSGYICWLSVMWQTGSMSKQSTNLAVSTSHALR